MMKLNISLIFLTIPCVIFSSPFSVPAGGTGLTNVSAGGLLYSTAAITMAVLPIGTSGQVLKVSGGVPTWSNVFPGYTAGSNFAYAGSTSILAASPNQTMIISATAPASITASATDNTAVGYNALNSVASNTTCTAVGSGALQNCTANSNTAAGYQALYNCSSATQNTAVGYQALYNITTGTTANTAVGYQALYTNQTGANNSAAGESALYNCTSGNNSALGYQAAYSNQGGSPNTAAGYQALYSNQSGNDNLAVGYQALYNNTVSNNVGVGYQALYTNSTATPNVAVGYKALYTNLSGENNTASGYQALTANSTGHRNTACGSGALASSTGSDNTACGYNALNVCTGSQNTALGSGAGATATTGSNNIYIGYNAAPISVSESNNTVIGNSSTATAYMFGISGVTSAGASNVVINASGQMGTIVSSKRFKTNIVDTQQADAQKILDFQVVKYHINGDATKELYYGLLAEQVHEIMPEVVTYNKDDEIQSVQYYKLIPLIIKMLQKQENEIFELETNITTLEDLEQQLELKIIELELGKGEC